MFRSGFLFVSQLQEGFVVVVVKLNAVVYIVASQFVVAVPVS